MSSQESAQTIAERYAKGEVDLEAAIQRMIAILKVRNAAVEPASISISRPDDGRLSPAHLERMATLLREIDRRLSAGE